jgi:hypothetical protein
MKRYLILALLLALLATTSTAQAQGPDFTEANAQLYDFSNNLVLAQQSYRDVHDEYSQILPSNTCPSDQNCLDISGLLTDTLVINVAINVYQGPGGAGYEIVAEYEVDGQTWQRVRQYGPETWREHDWVQVPEEQYP